MGAQREQYLVNVDSQEREREVVKRFCATQVLLDDLLCALGIPAGFHWIALGIPHGRLVEGRKGDVDLLAGPLAWKDPAAIGPLIAKNQSAHPEAPAHLHIYCAALELAGASGLQWPPPMQHLVAIEAKCAYFDVRRRGMLSLKGSKSNIRNLRMQLDELLFDVPFNRVALLDFIVNPPSAGNQGQAWLNAANFAAASLEQMKPSLQGRLPSDSPSGHFVMSWGAVEGDTEASRGTGGPIMLRPAIENSRLGEAGVQERRGQMAARLSRPLANRPQPTSFPVIFDSEVLNHELIA